MSFYIYMHRMLNTSSILPLYRIKKYPRDKTGLSQGNRDKFSIGDTQQQTHSCVAGGSGYPRELLSRTRVQKAAEVTRRTGRSFARGFAARENSLAGFAAKSFARAPTPASDAGYKHTRMRSAHEIPRKVF